jgi:hypothetical protein
MLDVEGVERLCSLPPCLDYTSRPWIARQTFPDAKPPRFADEALECSAISARE